MFLDDSGYAVVSTDNISMRPADTESPASLHDNESPASTQPVGKKVAAPGPVLSTTTHVTDDDTQIRNSTGETKRPCTSNNNEDVDTLMESPYHVHTSTDATVDSEDISAACRGRH